MCVSVLHPRVKPQDHLSTSLKINVGISFIKHRMIWKNCTHLRKPSCALKQGGGGEAGMLISPVSSVRDHIQLCRSERIER